MTQAQFIIGLRKLADLYEKHDGLPVPNDLSIYVWHTGSDDDMRNQLAAAARAMGKTEKSYDAAMFRLSGEISEGFKLEYVAYRSTVCRKVKVMREVEEWDCDPILEPKTDGGAQ